MNRRIPNGTYGGVRGRGLVTPSYSIWETVSTTEYTEAWEREEQVIWAYSALSSIFLSCFLCDLCG